MFPWVPRKTSFVSFSRYPAGLVYWGKGVNNQRLTLQLIMSLPPNPHPVEVFRCTHGHIEKPVSLVFRGTLRGLSIGGRVINKRLTLQLIMSLPPNPHPVEVFRCSHHKGTSKKQFRWFLRGTLRGLSIGGRVINKRLTLQVIMSLPPNPHPVEVFRGTLRGLSIGGRGLTINDLRYS